MYIITKLFCDNLPTCIDFINVLFYIIVKDSYTIKLYPILILPILEKGGFIYVKIVW